MTPKTITQISYLLQQGIRQQVFSGRLNVYILRASFLLFRID